MYTANFLFNKEVAKEYLSKIKQNYIWLVLSKFNTSSLIEKGHDSESISGIKWAWIGITELSE